MTVKEYFLLENGKPFFVSECYSNNRLDSEPSVKKISVEKLETLSKVKLTKELSELYSIRRDIEKQRLDVSINIYLADHCNLNCSGCCTFSPIAPKKFLSLDNFKNDMKRLSILTQANIYRIVLLGGEPLLNTQCKDFFYWARYYFPDIHIALITNGILLKKQKEDFWKSMSKNSIELIPSLYPIKIDWKSIQEICSKYNIQFAFASGEDSETDPTKLKNAEFWFSAKMAHKPIFDINDSFYKCHQRKDCLSLVDGKLYPCSVASRIHILNEKYGVNYPTDNYLDIYKATSNQELVDFVSSPVPLCKFCGMPVKEPAKWQLSKRDKDEWIFTDKYF